MNRASKSNGMHVNRQNPRFNKQRTKCDKRSIFKLIKVGLDSEFSFFQIGFLTKVKELSISFNLIKIWWVLSWN